MWKGQKLFSCIVHNTSINLGLVEFQVSTILISARRFVAIGATRQHSLLSFQKILTLKDCSRKPVDKRPISRYISATKNIMGKLPSMIVFDLDDCLWTPEMHELPGCPEIPVHGELDPTGSTSQKGVVGLQVPRYRDTVTLYDGARRVLYELATNPIYKDVLLATASSSLEPSYSYACLAGIEILPGRTIGDMMSYNQIGRTGNLSPDKVTHFRKLYEESGVPYEEMLFFDDWYVRLLDSSTTIETDVRREIVFCNLGT